MPVLFYIDLFVKLAAELAIRYNQGVMLEQLGPLEQLIEANYYLKYLSLKI